MLKMGELRLVYKAIVLSVAYATLTSCSPQRQVIESCGSGHWTRTGPFGQVGSVTVDPAHKGHVFVTNSFDGIPFRTFDGGRTWIRIKDIPHGAAGFAISADGSAVYFGSYRSLDGGLHWTHLPHDPVLGGAGAEVVIDPRDPRVLMGLDSNDHGILLRSSDAGDSWSRVSFGKGWWGPMGYAFDPTHPGTAYALATPLEGGVFLFASRDDGVTWRSMGRSRRADGNLTVTSSGTFYASSYLSSAWHLVVSRDQGLTFRQLAGPTPGRRGSTVVVDYSGDETRTFVATRPGVYETNSYGASWRRVGEVDGVLDIALDPNSRTLFAGTGHGLYECSISSQVGE